jgi:type IV pilus assembly protein PilV
MTIPKLHQSAGFTLLEVLVALLVISIGLLGMAGVQALSINNTNTARMRGIAAIKVESLAAAMHANTAYWQNVSGTVTQSTVPTAGTCGSSACTASQVAGYDVAQWSSDLTSSQLALPSASGTFSCTSSTTAPVSCTISVSWQEKTLAPALTSITASNILSSASYQMVVQP